METEQWVNKIPLCLIGTGVDDAKTLQEAQHLALVQLDLIEEGQDGTEDFSKQDIKEIKKFIYLHSKY